MAWSVGSQSEKFAIEVAVRPVYQPKYELSPRRSNQVYERWNGMFVLTAMSTAVGVIGSSRRAIFPARNRNCRVPGRWSGTDTGSLSIELASRQAGLRAA